MHYRQIEISPEPQGKACLAAALAANNDDPARFLAADGSDEALGLDAMMSRLRCGQPVEP